VANMRPILYCFPAAFLVQFLYTPFPVESCLDQRISENLNAEIASGTIKNVADCVGYLTWTFFARRVKINPSYYGAESGSEKHVETRLLAVVQESIEKLRISGCVELKSDDEYSEIIPTALGIAASQYYLTYRTPKQMQLGIREARRMIMNALKSDGTLAEAEAHATGRGLRIKPCSRTLKVDELSIAWLIFVVCSTHEFDELPVRHNEEFLNQELSEAVMWGPDTADLLTDKKGARRFCNIEIFEDPHTKCFLLMQAYLEHTKLPISDYVNDTKSVVENFPRLLGAMSFIAATESIVAGSFELLTQFSRTRQIFKARCRVNDDPLLQLPGFDDEVVRRMTTGDKESHQGSLLELRAMERKDVDSLMQQLVRGPRRRNRSIDDTINALFSLPLYRLANASIRIENEKATGKSIGKLQVTVEVERQNNMPGKGREKESLTLTLLLGSMQQRFLLAHESVRVSRFGRWTINKELSFDWSIAIADGGESKGSVVLRLLVDEVRGLDTEIVLGLQ
jgi:replicative superfamily II helicase